jgi:hypothetical protein
MAVKLLLGLAIFNLFFLLAKLTLNVLGVALL